MCLKELTQLTCNYPLPKGWGQVQIYDDRVKIGLNTIGTCGLSAVSSIGKMAIGSAGQLFGNPITRAYFELLERVSIIEALEDPKRIFEIFDSGGNFIQMADFSTVFPPDTSPSDWVHSKSNAVAIQSDFFGAAESAESELKERHQLLRSWFGEIKPRRIPVLSSNLEKAIENLREIYDIEVYSIGSSSIGLKKEEVVAVFAFPHSSDNPMSFGFSAHENGRFAQDKAFNECVQRIGFLWGEEIPAKEPEFSPTPDFHQSLYLVKNNRALIKSWLEGEFKEVSGKTRSHGEISFADLTPANLTGRVRVLRAISKHAIPLYFGKNYPEFEQSYDSVGLAIHPLA